MIEKARKGAFEDSAYGVLDAGRIYFVDKIANQNKFEGATFTFPEGGDLKVSGEKPAGGTLSLDSTGKQALAIYDKDKKWCALKGYEEEKITIKEYKEEECKVSRILSGAAKTIADKNIEGNTEGLFTDDFGNIRYRGNDSIVKNYVTVNDEVWRIIGVFDGKVKIIRNERIPNPNDGSVPYNVSYPNSFKWDSHTIATGAESDNGRNDWSTSDLKDYLNNEYYNSLQDAYKNMIGEAKYYLGGFGNEVLDKKIAYEKERGTTVYTGRPTEWVGKIGLMYLSDYGYAVFEDCTESLHNYGITLCKSNNWLYKGYEQSTLASMANSSSGLIGVSSGGSSYGKSTSQFMTVRPVFFLKSNVKVISGDGTASIPYLLAYE